MKLALGLGVVVVLLGALMWIRLPPWLASRHVNDSQSRAKRESQYRQLLAQYFGGSAVLVGIIVSLLQNQTTNANFQRDFAARLEHDNRTEFFKSASLLQDKDEGTRFAAILSLSSVGARDAQLQTAMVKSLVSFIQRERSIDRQQKRINESVTPDVQAAITALGQFKRPPCEGDCVTYNFSRLSLVDADFSGGDFSYSYFNESNLRHANFMYADVRKSTFIVANFDYRCLDEVKQHRYDANVINPDDFLHSASWWQQHVRADFFHADLRDSLFRGADLMGARFSYAHIDGAEFQGSNLTFASFTDALLTKPLVGNFDKAWRMGDIEGIEIIPIRGDATPYSNNDCGKENMWNLGGAPQMATQ